MPYEHSIVDVTIVVPISLILAGLCFVVIRRLKERLRAFVESNVGTKFLWMIVFFGLLLTTIIVALIPENYIYHHDRYYERAILLAKGAGFLDPFGNPTTYFPPGYSMILSLFFTIGASLKIAAITNLLLLLLAAWSTYKLSSFLFGQRAGLFSLALLSIFPSQLFQPLIVMSDFAFAALVISYVATLVFFFGGTSEISRTILGAFGIIGLALILLTRGNGLFLIFVTILLPFSVKKPQVIKKNFKLSLVIVITAAMLTLPWAIRNYQILGRLAFPSSNAGINLWIGNNPHATGGYLNPPPIAGADYGDDIVASRRLGYERNGHKYGYEAIQYILGQPLTFIYMGFLKLARSLLLDLNSFSPLMEKTVFRGPIVIIMAIFINSFYYFGWLAALAGYRMSLRTGNLLSKLLFPLVFFLIFALPVFLFFGSGRFHVVLIPFLALYSGYWLCQEQKAVAV